MTSSSFDIITMTIDRHNIITDVGSAWVDVAAKGGASDTLAPQNVIGQPIENYLGGDVTQMYYDAVFKLCRLKNEVLTRAYRCDSPTHQRFMQLTLTPKADGSIEMLHETLKEIPFENSVNIVDMHKETTLRAPAYTKRCNICNRLQYPNQTRWLAPEDLSQNAPLHVKVIHTICPDCKAIDWIRT
jgi:hypothetical protein